MLVSHVDDSGFLFFQTVGRVGPPAARRPARAPSGLRPTGRSTASSPGRRSTSSPTTRRRSVVHPKDMWVDIGASDKEPTRRRSCSIADAVTVHLGYPGACATGSRQRPRHGQPHRRLGRLRGDAPPRPGEGGRVHARRRVHGPGGDRPAWCAQTAALGIDPHVAHRGRRDPRHGLPRRSTSASAASIDLGRWAGHPARAEHQSTRVGARLEARARLTRRTTSRSQAAALGRACAERRQLRCSSPGLGVATGLVQLPNRYMHSAVETIALSLTWTRPADLLAWRASPARSAADDSFIP